MREWDVSGAAVDSSTGVDALVLENNIKKCGATTYVHATSTVVTLKDYEGTRR